MGSLYVLPSLLVEVSGSLKTATVSYILTAVFPCDPALAGSLGIFFLHLFRNRIFGDKWPGFLQARHLS